MISRQTDIAAIGFHDGRHTAATFEADQAEDKTAPVTPELQAFVNARGRPAVFLFIAESMSIGHVLELRDVLGIRVFDELDMVINSGGGDINSAYQIVELLRLRSNKLNACVPFIAKSAATLLCVGADKIVLDELAQLGPLDTQVYEEEKVGKGDYHSALNPFKSLEELQKFAAETLDLAMKVIIERSGMPLDECLRHATEFVSVTSGPLFTQLSPGKLGEYSRALSVGEEYGKRLLQRHTTWNPTQIETVIRRLVYEYPSHDYIIDYHELTEMGFRAELFAKDEHAAVEALLPTCLHSLTQRKTLISLVEPATPPGNHSAKRAARSLKDKPVAQGETE